jgi:hypothetical protein
LHSVLLAHPGVDTSDLFIHCVWIDATPRARWVDWCCRRSRRSSVFLDVIHTLEKSMYVKKRITLTISPEVSQRAKMLARNRNTSVSHLIETLIDQAASSDAVAGHASLVQRWRGKLTTRVREEPKFHFLKKKYDL